MADEVADRGRQMAEDVREAAQRGAGRLKEKASQYAGQAKQYAQQGYDYAADKTLRAKESAEGYIEQYPWYTIGVALGVGVLIGMLLRGGRSRD